MADTPTKQHITMTPKKAVDHKESFSKPYYTFNAGCLDDEKWTDRDLQKLCIKLGISVKGTREEVIARLINWHRYPQNPNRRCAGSNFMLLEVNVSPTKNGQNNGSCPTYLSPLKCKPKRNADGSPVSILSAQKKSDKKNLKFSLFNGTKLIPPRESIHHQWLREDGVHDPEAWFEDDSDDELDNISKEISEAGCGVAVAGKVVTLATDKKTSACEDDWLSSDINLPKDSPYAKQAVARTTTSVSTQPNFDDENEVADKPITRSRAAAGLTKTTEVKQITGYSPAPRPRALSRNTTENQLVSGIAGLTM